MICFPGWTFSLFLFPPLSGNSKTSPDMLLKIFPAFVAIALTAFFSGCASSPDAHTPAANQSRHAETLLLKVTGGSDAAATNAAQVARVGYATGVTKAIHQTGLFAKVVTAGEGSPEYQLEIAIADLQPPEIGAVMTATVETTWTLTRVSNGYQIWQKSISTSHTTQANEAFTGVERVHLAIDGATQANIREGIKQLNSVSLP